MQIDQVVEDIGAVSADDRLESSAAQSAQEGANGASWCCSAMRENCLSCASGKAAGSGVLAGASSSTSPNTSADRQPPLPTSSKKYMPNAAVPSAPMIRARSSSMRSTRSYFNDAPTEGDSPTNGRSAADTEWRRTDDRWQKWDLLTGESGPICQMNLTYEYIGSDDRQCLSAAA